MATPLDQRRDPKNGKSDDHREDEKPEECPVQDSLSGAVELATGNALCLRLRDLPFVKSSDHDGRDHEDQ